MNELDAMQKRVARFAAEREWAQYHDAKNLVMALSAEIGELSSLFRWVDNKAADGMASEESFRKALTEEIGDVGILLLLLCNRVSIDLLGAVSDKLTLNALKYPLEESRGRAERP